MSNTTALFATFFINMFFTLLDSWAIQVPPTLRILVFILTVLGLIFVFIDNYSKNNSKKLQKNNGESDRFKEVDVNIKKKLEKNRESVLLTISNNSEIITEEVVELLSIGAEAAASHIDELKEIKFVKIGIRQGSEWNGTQYREEWSTDILGRKYLMYHKLIK